VAHPWSAAKQAATSPDARKKGSTIRRNCNPRARDYRARSREGIEVAAMKILADALRLAIEAHADQKWRDGETPYITHPLAVSALVLRFGGDEEQAAAALVHDALEVAPRLTPGIERLAQAFADPPGTAGDWQSQKRAYLEKLRGLDERALLVVGAEELHEITDLLLELRQKPPRQVWARYPAHAMNMAWYFKEILSILHSRLKAERARGLVAELAAAVRQLGAQVFEGA
jgi:hypothetical protein